MEHKMLTNFNNFLTEAAAEEGKQKHLPHATEHVFHGHEGVARTESGLRGLYNALLGRKRGTPERIEKKIDGAPAFHIGKDKEGKIFVATKSMFNKNPKINYTHEDIERNHGHAPGLVDALKGVLDHAHKVLPADMKPGEMYKGDLLFNGQGGDKGLQDNDSHVSAQPNVLNYMWPKDSPEGAKAANSKIGFALHTSFDKNGNAQPISSKQRAKFIDHPDVFNYDPSAEMNPANFTPEEQRAFEGSMENARKSYSRIKPEHYDNLSGHGDHLVSFINGRVRNGQEGSGSVDDYLDFLNGRAQKDIDSVKTAAAKERKTKAHATLMNQVITNKKDLQHMLDMHGHFQNAKHILHDVMQKNSSETIQYPNGEPGGHEGYVATHKDPTTGTPVQDKIVDQRPGENKFANVNLSGGGNISKAKEALNNSFTLTDRLIESFQESLGATTSNDFKYDGPNGIHDSFSKMTRRIKPPVEGHIPQGKTINRSRKEHLEAMSKRNKVAVREETEHHGDHAVIVGGFSPPTIAHEKLFNQATDGGHDSVNIFTTESSRRPISASDKVSYIKKVAPKANVATTKTPFHALSQLYASGKRGSVTIYGGSDREGIENQLSAYNGKEGKHGHYKFDSINFKKVGEDRSEGSSKVEDLAGVSGTKARASKSPKELKKYLPDALHPHAEKIFNQLKESEEMKSFNEHLIDEGFWDNLKAAIPTSFSDAAKNLQTNVGKLASMADQGLETIRKKGVEYNILSPKVLKKPEPQTVNRAAKGDMEQTVNRAAMSDIEQTVNREKKADRIQPQTVNRAAKGDREDLYGGTNVGKYEPTWDDPNLNSKWNNRFRKSVQLRAINSKTGFRGTMGNQPTNTSKLEREKLLSQSKSLPKENADVEQPKPKVINVSADNGYVNPNLSPEKKSSLEALIAAKMKSMGK